MSRRLVLPLAALLLAGAGNAVAGEQILTSRIPEQRLTPSYFDEGRYEISITSGVLFSPIPPSSTRPKVKYTMSEVQVGYMVMDVHGGNAWWRGNLELVGSGFAGAIFDGRGSYLAGSTFWLRHNFVRDHWTIVPYGQAGVGITLTDMDDRVIGQNFNFNLNLAAGARWFFAKDWALSLEYRYQHISCANLAPRNIGVNSHGPMAGISYFF